MRVGARNISERLRQTDCRVEPIQDPRDTQAR